METFFLKQRPCHPDNTNKMDLKHWLNRPLDHMHKYPAIFEYLRSVTAGGNPDVKILKEAVEVMRVLQGVARLKAFQMAMGEGLTVKSEWHDFVPEDVRSEIPNHVAKRQA